MNPALTCQRPINNSPTLAPASYMFDNTQPNIILLSDVTDIMTMNKTMGPYKVAHVLRKAGFEVAVIHHLSVFSLKEIKHMLEHMISAATLFVGVNNVFYSNTGLIIERPDGHVEFSNTESGAILPHGRDHNNSLREIVLGCNPRCKLVLGGPTARDIEANKYFDYVIAGFAECSIVNLAQHLLDPDVTLIKSRKSIWGFTVLEDTKAENYDFVMGDMKYQDHDVVQPGETLILEVSRGCIFKCAFCSYPMNGKKKLDYIRHRDLIQNEMIDNYERFGVTRYVFQDDTVNDSAEKCKMIWEISRSLPFKLEWFGFLRLDLLAAHRETADWLFDSGCRAAFCGIETLHPETARIIGKSGNYEKMFATLADLKSKYGNAISLHGAFIFGLPQEPVSSMQHTAEFLLDPGCPLDSWDVRPLSIRPGNQNYDNGFLSDLDRNYQKYGYRDLGHKKSDGSMYSHMRQEFGQLIWANDHTDRLEVEHMVTDLQQRKAQLGANRITGSGAFYIASLDIDLSEILNKLESKINWYQIDKLKLQRAVAYKKMLATQCAVPDMSAHPVELTFSEWIKNRRHLD